MHHPSIAVSRLRFVPLLVLALLGVAADNPPAKPKAPKDTKSLNVPAMPEVWQTVAKSSLRPGEIDQLIAARLHRDQIATAPRTTDEQFIRRVKLDLTGELPTPAEVEKFVRDPDSHKRARLIDALLASDGFNTHWGRYWRDVIAARATAQMVFLRFSRDAALEKWLTEQSKARRSWAEIARDLITADGTLNFPQDAGQNGAVAFLLCHFGPGADNERAAETARVFLGIQIQCAQCHNHPSDVWKRDQFHELAAFYSRTRERVIRNGQMNRTVALTSAPIGEHQMPRLDDPKKSTTMYPRFLLSGDTLKDQSDKQRRQALADAVTSPDNYWFAAAFVNRTWGELMGQAFYQPVDDMGPMKEAVLPGVLVRMAAGFRADNYDVRSLFRAILNSQVYQRQVRLGQSSDEHLRFAASYPTRLRADALWQSLVNVLGTMQGPPRPANPRLQAAGGGLLARFASFEAAFKREFAFDPSLKSDEVEGTIPQALLMMNNPVVAERIQAKDANALGKLLKQHQQNADAIRALYLQTLARKPTDREMEKCRKYIAKVGNRAEAFEDLLWALINSTEFQTKR